MIISTFLHTSFFRCWWFTQFPENLIMTAKKTFLLFWCVHMQTHNGEKPNKCYQCKYSCSGAGDLKKHMRTHSREKPYKCDKCDHACTNASHLKRHGKTHNLTKTILKKCNRCKYSCSTLTMLKEHKQVHRKETRFMCEVCKYICAQPGTLKRHSKIHTGEKLFKCNKCGDEFSRADHLTRHAVSCENRVQVLNQLQKKLQHLHKFWGISKSQSCISIFCKLKVLPLD